MLQRTELPLPAEIPALDEDPALFDPSPEWFVPVPRNAHQDDEEDLDEDGLGLRAMIDDPEVLSKAWHATERERPRRRGRRAKLRVQPRAGSKRGWRDD